MEVTQANSFPAYVDYVISDLVTSLAICFMVKLEESRSFCFVFLSWYDVEKMVGVMMERDSLRVSRMGVKDA